MDDGFFDGSFMAFLLYTLWIFILISFIFVVIRIIMDVFRSQDLGGWGKFWWLFFIIFLPILGTLIYLFARGGSMAQRDLEDMRQRREYDKEYTKTLMGEAGVAGSAGEIERAKALLDSGAINQAEFDTLKAKALA